MFLNRNLILYLTLLTVFFFSCTRTIPVHTSSAFFIDGKYDSHFPLQPTSEHLQRISQSVHMISSFTFYRTYIFDLKSAVTRSQINGPDFSISERAIDETISQKPGSGTSTIIYADRKKILLLTCLHIIDEPDTAITYYYDYGGKETQFIQTVSTRVRTNITVPSIPSIGKIEIIAKDKINDLALVSLELTRIAPFPEKTFNYRWGNTEELELGTFVYLLGFPNGKKMLSTAVVSSPNRGDNHNFLVDATLHRGISGGLIIALKDGVPNFEFLGMVNAVSAREANVLRPDPATSLALLARDQPYKGEIFVDKQLSVVYGITFAVSINNIREFVEKSREVLTDNGYDLVIP